MINWRFYERVKEISKKVSCYKTNCHKKMSKKREEPGTDHDWYRPRLVPTMQEGEEKKMTDQTANILIIDDEAEMRKILRDALQKENYLIDTADNFRAVFKKIEQQEYDLILLDLKIPDIDGIEMLEKIREENIMTPLLIITDYGSIESNVKAMKLGAVDYLRKPCEPEEVKEQVAEILARKDIEDFDETDYEALILKAKEAINERKFDLAHSFLKRSIIMAEDHAEPFNLLGVIAEMKGDKERAMKMYRASLDIDPAYEPAQDNIERASQFNDRSEQANLGDDERS